jgi:hypothetical protein
MAVIDVSEDVPGAPLPGAPAPPAGPDPETRHRLRKALRILLAARRRDERGGKDHHDEANGGIQGDGHGTA